MCSIHSYLRIYWLRIIRVVVWPQQTIVQYQYVPVVEPPSYSHQYVQEPVVTPQQQRMAYINPDFKKVGDRLGEKIASPPPAAKQVRSKLCAYVQCLFLSNTQYNMSQDHIDVIITYVATCLTKKQQTLSNLRFLKHQVLPKMHQHVSIRYDQNAPLQNR